MEQQIKDRPAQTLTWQQMQTNRIFYHVELRQDTIAQMKAAYKSQTGIDMDLDDEGTAEYNYRMGRERELDEGRAADFCHDVNRDLERQFQEKYRSSSTSATGMSAPMASPSSPAPPLPPPPLSPSMPPPSLAGEVGV